MFIVSLSYQCHRSFLCHETFDAFAAVFGYVDVASGFAFMSQIGAVPALFYLGGGEHQRAVTVENIEFVVGEVVGGEGLEDIVGLKTWCEGVGKIDSEDSDGDPEGGVAGAAQGVAGCQTNEQGVLAEVGEGEYHGAVGRGVAVAEIPERRGGVFGEVGKLHRRVLGIDIVGRELYLEDGVGVHCDFLCQGCGAAAVCSVSHDAVHGGLERRDLDLLVQALRAESWVGRVGCPLEIGGFSGCEGHGVAGADALLVGVEVRLDEVQVDAVPCDAAVGAGGLDIVSAVLCDVGHQACVVGDHRGAAAENLVPVEGAVVHGAVRCDVRLVAVADDGVAVHGEHRVLADADGEGGVGVAVYAFRDTVAGGVGIEVVGAAGEQGHVGGLVEAHPCRGGL